MAPWPPWSSDIGAIELTENRRQREPWERQALDALRLGRADVALATYERAGRVHSAPSLDQARLELVERWAESYRRRPRRRHAGGGAGRREAPQRRRPRGAAVRRADLGPDVLVVDDVGFAVGDKVVCLRNDRRIGVVNGTIGTVERAVGRGLAIGTAEGQRVLSAAYLEAGHLSHGYALTIHKAQGLTVDRAYVLAGESLSQESGYVAMSRAREVTELFVPLAVASDDRARPAPVRGVRPPR